MMRSSAKDEKCFFIIIISVCFFLSAFVFTIPVYAAGKIVAWGCGNWEDLGQCDVPSPNMDFTAISAGHRFSLGLKNTGSIVTWGGWLLRSMHCAVAQYGFYSHLSRLVSFAWSEKHRLDCGLGSRATGTVRLAVLWSMHFAVAQYGFYGHLGRRVSLAWPDEKHRLDCGLGVERVRSMHCTFAQYGF